MAKKAKKAKASSNGKTPVGRIVNLAVEVLEGTPAHYANYMEVIHSKWDFSLIVARLPAKPSSAKIAEIQASGGLMLPADLVITFPPFVLPGLIRALTAQKDAYEKLTGIELTELGNP